MKSVTLFQTGYQTPIAFAIVDAFHRDSLHVESNHTTKILALSPPDALGSSMTLIVYLLDVSC